MPLRAPLSVMLEATRRERERRAEAQSATAHIGISIARFPGPCAPHAPARRASRALMPCHCGPARAARPRAAKCAIWRQPTRHTTPTQFRTARDPNDIAFVSIGKHRLGQAGRYMPARTFPSSVKERLSPTPDRVIILPGNIETTIRNPSLLYQRLG